MKPKLHFIVGPTTTGKTDRAVSLAAETGASVVAVDRIQCHPELAVGSGRPSVAELRSTRREYLCERAVADGELPPGEANKLLHEAIARLARRDATVVLEGGSISMLKAMARDASWREYEWTFERLHLPSIEVFKAKAATRVRSMLQSAGASMLDECAALWPDLLARPVLMGIVGYRTIARYAQAHGTSIAELARSATADDIERLTGLIASDFLGYAKVQESELPLSWFSGSEVYDVREVPGVPYTAISSRTPFSSISTPAPPATISPRRMTQ